MPEQRGGPAWRATSTGAAMTVDVLGSIFFLLTRYEEIVIGTRDRHGRFPASASIAGREGSSGARSATMSTAVGPDASTGPGWNGRGRRSGSTRPTTSTSHGRLPVVGPSSAT